MADLRHLRAFVAVAEELSFTRAAERLHMAQQAVSKTVAQLERELGVELLVRTTRTVSLTDAGRDLLGDGREVLAAADAAFARAAAHGTGLTGTVTVGATPAVGSDRTSELGRALARDAPGLSLRLVDVRPGQILEVLTARRVDVVLARAVPPIEGLVADELPPTPAAIAVPSGHRLAGMAAARLADLDGERLLVWSRPGTPYTDLLVALCRSAGAVVEPVESRVTGSRDLVDVEATGALAIVPSGWRAAAPGRVIPLDGPVGLPLRAVRLAGRPPARLSRVLDALRAPAAHPVPGH